MLALRLLGVQACVWLPLCWGMLAAGQTPTAERQGLPKLSDKRIERLVAAGDRLADQGDYQAALEKYTRAFQGVVSRIRGQDFLLPVKPSIYNRQELGEEMLRQLELEFTPEELLLMDAAYKVWGLVPRELDTAATLTKLLTEEVAGFYDPDNKRMVLIVEEGQPQQPSWLGSLLGTKAAFDKEEQKTTLAHELTHALQDQLYDLNALEERIKDDDDMLLAFSALVEGDATLLMFLQAGDMGGVDELDPTAMRATFNLMSWMLPLSGGPTLRTAPPIFRESLTFPYFQGMLFALALADRGGWDNVHHSYRSPPVSTEQILHPSKYGAAEDYPQRVILPPLSQLTDAGWNRLGGNCLGELQTAIMFKRVFGGSQAAAGWDGDRYEIFRHSAGNLGLVSVSVWDSAGDAREFADAYRTYRLQQREKQPARPTHPTERPPAPRRAAEAAGQPAVVPAAEPADASQETAPIANLAIFADNAQTEILVREDQVWIVEGFSPMQTAALLDELGHCRFEEKRFPQLR